MLPSYRHKALYGPARSRVREILKRVRVYIALIIGNGTVVKIRFDSDLIILFLSRMIWSNWSGRLAVKC